MNSTELLKEIKNQLELLKHKGYDKNSFKSGYLLGYAKALQLQQTGVSGSYFAVCYSTNEGLFFVDEEDNQTKSQGNAKKFKSVKEAEMYINKELCGFGNVIPL